MQRKRGRPRNNPKYIDVTNMRNTTEMREPLQPPKMECLAQAIVRLNGDVRRASNEVLDPLSDAMYTEFEQLPEMVQRRVKCLLNRAANETVATREEVELLLTRTIRGQELTVEPIDAIRELCKMRGWYEAVNVNHTHEIKIPERISGMSDEDLNKIIELGNKAKTLEASNEVEDNAIEAEIITDTTERAVMKEATNED